jgi:hypothetical protein
MFLRSIRLLHYTLVAFTHSCSEPGHMHTQAAHAHGAALLTGHVPVDRLISVEDCCLISVGVEGVS